MNLRAVTFGDLELSSWGVAVSPGSELPSFVVLGAEHAVRAAVIEGDGAPESPWRIAGDGIELTVSPDGSLESPAAPTASSPELSAGEGGPGESGFDQFVTVRGRLPAAGAEELELVGCRSEWAEDLRPGRFRVLRDVGAWFAPGEGLAVVAVRPRRAGGHGDERLTATLFAAGERLPVAEPRLSTTYERDGWPLRATLELWLSSQEEQSDAEEHPAQYPRRAAGEAAGEGVRTEDGALEIRARPFRWRSEGRLGVGVYLLVRAE